jgi:predicted MPP superfamily phosphohydrolase
MNNTTSTATAKTLLDHIKAISIQNPSMNSTMMFNQETNRIAGIISMVVYNDAVMLHALKTQDLIRSDYRTLTPAELISKLSLLNENAKVHFVLGNRCYDIKGIKHDKAIIMLAAQYTKYDLELKDDDNEENEDHGSAQQSNVLTLSPSVSLEETESTTESTSDLDDELSTEFHQQESINSSQSNVNEEDKRIDARSHHTCLR